MRLGLSLRRARHKSGNAYYTVPLTPQKNEGGDLSRFVAWVVVNRPEEGVMVVQVTPFGFQQRTSSAESMQATIPYHAIGRCRKFSAFSIDPGPEITGDQGGKGLRRPGSVAGFAGTRHRPYRTTEEVLLR